MSDASEPMTDEGFRKYGALGFNIFYEVNGIGEYWGQTMITFRDCNQIDTDEFEKDSLPLINNLYLWNCTINKFKWRPVHNTIGNIN